MDDKPNTTGEYVERTYCHKCENKVFDDKEEGDLCPQCAEPLKVKFFRVEDKVDLGRLGQDPTLKSELTQIT